MKFKSNTYLDNNNIYITSKLQFRSGLFFSFSLRFFFDKQEYNKKRLLTGLQEVNSKTIGFFYPSSFASFSFKKVWKDTFHLIRAYYNKNIVRWVYYMTLMVSIITINSRGYYHYYRVHHFIKHGDKNILKEIPFWLLTARK